MREDGGLPETSLDDSSTAELDGLKSADEVIRSIQRGDGYGGSLTSFSLFNI